MRKRIAFAISAVVVFLCLTILLIVPKGGRVPPITSTPTPTPPMVVVGRTPVPICQPCSTPIPLPTGTSAQPTPEGKVYTYIYIPPYLAAGASPEGVVAVKADKSVEVYDLNGNLKKSLPPFSGLEQVYTATIHKGKVYVGGFADLKPGKPSLFTADIDEGQWSAVQGITVTTWSVLVCNEKLYVLYGYDLCELAPERKCLPMRVWSVRCDGENLVVSPPDRRSIYLCRGLDCKKIYEAEKMLLAGPSGLCGAVYFSIDEPSQQPSVWEWREGRVQKKPIFSDACTEYGAKAMGGWTHPLDPYKVVDVELGAGETLKISTITLRR